MQCRAVKLRWMHFSIKSLRRAAKQFPRRRRVNRRIRRPNQPRERRSLTLDMVTCPAFFIERPAFGGVQRLIGLPEIFRRRRRQTAGRIFQHHRGGVAVRLDIFSALSGSVSGASLPSQPAVAFQSQLKTPEQGINRQIFPYTHPRQSAQTPSNWQLFLSVGDSVRYWGARSMNIDDSRSFPAARGECF